MPESHEHDGEDFDASDSGDVEVTPELEAELRQAQLEKLKEAGFHA